jgi:NADH-quinone oxidoreductase subunit J
MVQALAFYMFAGVLIASGALVITSRNPVHSVLFLILAFFNAAGLFILLGAEFVAMILVIVYVGAVAVLFLFVVMMLDINFRELRSGMARFIPVGATVGLILLAELVLIFGGWAFAPVAATTIAAPAPATVTNTHALGRLFYTHYIYLFQAAGLILLVAMIGAIVLTLRERSGVRKQVIADQIGRRRDEVLAIRKVSTGTGV